MQEPGVINILFLGGAKRVSMAERFLAAGRSLGVHVSIFSYELNEDVPISAVGKVIVGLRWGDPDIFNHLTDAIRKWNIHIVLPFVDPAIAIVAALKEKAPQCFIPVSDIALCEMCYDKKQASEWFVAHGFLTPKETEQVPFIAKPRRGSAAKGIVRTDKEGERTMRMALIDREQYIFQEYISGEEYTVDCYVTPHREILSIVPRRRIEVIDGEVVKTVTLKDEQLIQFSRAILKAGNFMGPITIQFIREKNTGKIYALEINPRFGGGAIASIEAGANTPLLLLKNYLGIPTMPIDHWRANLLMMRAHREFFTYANHH